jgi:hypothetical protein
MKNILGCTRQSVERLYDMKGSSHDREVIKSNRLYNYNELKSMTLKDMDFKKLEGILRVEPDKARILHRALKLDSLFLKNLNLIDYSLLVAKVPSYLTSGALVIVTVVRNPKILVADPAPKIHDLAGHLLPHRRHRLHAGLEHPEDQ